MEKNPKVRIPYAGVVYGRVTQWVVINCMFTGLICTAIYLKADGYMNVNCLLDRLCHGDNIETIWSECTPEDTPISEPWYLAMFSRDDGIAMLAIIITCLSSAVGLWWAFFIILRTREGPDVINKKIYLVPSFVIAGILTSVAVSTLFFLSQSPK